MFFFSKFESTIRSRKFSRIVFAPLLYVFQAYRLSMLSSSKEYRRTWNQRIDDVLACPDRQFLKPVPGAGRISNGIIKMHNGLLIDKTSYYGYPILKMLRKGKGVHEPQEERVFQEVLTTMKPGAVMVELGCYWAFYSMWFLKSVQGAVTYLVEPSDIGIESAQTNLKLNGLKAGLTKSFVGNRTFINDAGEQYITVDGIVKEQKIDFIDVLHSDIQGFEFEMLQGASKLFQEKKVGYIFISTHSNELHQQCLSYLIDLDFIILANADLNDTFSWDGLIVARAPYYPGIAPVAISLKTRVADTQRD